MILMWLPSKGKSSLHSIPLLLSMLSIFCQNEQLRTIHRKQTCHDCWQQWELCSDHPWWLPSSSSSSSPSHQHLLRQPPSSGMMWPPQERKRPRRLLLHIALFGRNSHGWIMGATVALANIWSTLRWIGIHLKFPNCPFDGKSLKYSLHSHCILEPRWEYFSVFDILSIFSIHVTCFRLSICVTSLLISITSSYNCISAFNLKIFRSNHMG